MGTTPRQALEIFGQLVGCRHGRSPDQHWHHPDPTLQSRGYLHAEKIIRIAQASPAFLVGRSQPARPDHGQ